MTPAWGLQGQHCCSEGTTVIEGTGVSDSHSTACSLYVIWTPWWGHTAAPKDGGGCSGALQQQQQQQQHGSLIDNWIVDWLFHHSPDSLFSLLDQLQLAAVLVDSWKLDLWSHWSALSASQFLSLNFKLKAQEVEWRWSRSPSGSVRLSGCSGFSLRRISIQWERDQLWLHCPLLVWLPNSSLAASGPDSAWRGPVRLRGHLPVWAAGARLHHRLGMSRVCVAAEIPVWSDATTLQRPPGPHLCEYGWDLLTLTPQK